MPDGVTVPDAETVPDEFVLDEQLCFALYTASRAMNGCYRPMLDDLGLTYSQYAVMLVLWERRTITMGELCRRLHLDSGTLSPLLGRLEARGLVNRARRIQDERTVQITVTPEGAELRPAASIAQQAVVRASGYSRSELVEMRDALSELAARLRVGVPV